MNLEVSSLNEFPPISTENQKDPKCTERCAERPFLPLPAEEEDDDEGEYEI